MNFTDQYHQILTSRRPMIDLRAPVEYSKGAFEGSISMPLMTDDERAQVGTCYKEQGQDAAIELGHQLVGGDVREQRVNAWLAELKQQSEPLIYCFRGGLRSQTVAGFLKDAGLDVELVTGGYKAMRRFLIDNLIAQLEQQQLIVVAGPTGSGKTRVLTQIKHHVDLEHFANHRGSAFGGNITPQPPQISFENAVAAEFLRQADQSPKAIFVEDEGRLIGRCALPLELLQAITKAPRVRLQETIEYRTQVILEDYVIQPAKAYEQLLGDEGRHAFAEQLLTALSKIVKRLGGDRYQRVQTMMKDALEAQYRDGNLNLHRDWIGELLVNYYDPMYAYQLSKKPSEQLFVGDSAAVVDWANNFLGR